MQIGLKSTGLVPDLVTKLSRNASRSAVILGTPGGTDCELMSPSLAELSRPDMIGLLSDDLTSPKRSLLLNGDVAQQRRGVEPMHRARIKL